MTTPRHDLFLRIKQHLKDEESNDLRTYIESEELLPAGEIQHLNPQQILRKLEQKLKLPKGDLSLLVDLMTKIGRVDFAEEAEKIAEQERGVQSSSSQLKRKKENGDQPPVKRKVQLREGSAMEDVRKYFIFIKKKVSSDWEDLAFFLGFQQAAINNIAGRNPDDNSRCMDLLEEWLKQNGERATIEVLMKALSEAELQSTVDELKKKYPELHCSDPVLPVQLQLGLAPQTSEQIKASLWKLAQELFTAEVLMDDDRRRKAEQVLLSYKAFLTGLLSGSVILLLTFLRQTDVDRFYHNHYRVGEGTLSQQLSHILISDDLQDKVKGAQLIVRLQVKHEDYVRVRDRLGQGLDRTTSVDNLLALPPSSRHVDHSSLRGLDLAVVSTDRTEDVPALNFTAKQVQTAMHTSKEKSQQQLETMQGQVETGRIGVDAMMREVKMLREKNEKAEKILLEQKAEMNEEIQQLQESNKSLEVRIEELLTAKQPVASGSQQKDPGKEKSQQQVRHLEDQLQTMREQMHTAREQTDDMVRRLTNETARLKEKDVEVQKILMEEKEENKRLSEANKSMADTIEALMYALHTAKPKAGDQGKDPGKEEDPGKDPGKDLGKEEDPGKDPRKEEDPGKDPGKEEDLGKDPRKEEDPGKDLRKEEDPGKDPRKEEDPGKGPGKEEDPGKDPRKEEDPGKDPMKEEDPGKDSGKEEDPGKDPVKEEDPGKDPGKEEDTGKDPGKEEDTGNDPRKEEDPGKDPGKEEDPGKDPGKEEDPGKDPGKNPGKNPGKEEDPGKDLGKMEDPGKDPRKEEHLGKDPGKDFLGCEEMDLDTFYMAVEEGDVQTLRRGLDAGVDLRVKRYWQGSGHQTSLHVASRHGQTEVAALLIKHGADLEARDKVSRNNSVLTSPDLNLDSVTRGSLVMSPF
ncbi:PREDICTED: uncharacterized protein LOC109466407 [Branchiostoma belcheri]|uniref:Uncharacterized protein LOC109466407 n=1 Tax=Branchiostoma belcheri TaxID=7741 RepID=A0A6P4YR07_BRABE|nr:PREDICTED: uncharacterized protein LOC109466407 [Branchiostoma belcheri]